MVCSMEAIYKVNSQLSDFHKGASFLFSCHPLDQILTTTMHLSKGLEAHIKIFLSDSMSLYGICKDR